eukprot:1240561-Pleurochrysis_carterae.AAC.2
MPLIHRLPYYSRSKVEHSRIRSLRLCLLEPCLSWRVLTTLYLYRDQLYGDHPDRAGIAEGGRGAGTGVGAGRTCGVAPGWLRSQAVSAMCATGTQNLRSGARALRKYACDAKPKRQTVHAGQHEQCAASVGFEQSTSEEGKKVNKRLEAKNNCHLSYELLLGSLLLCKRST